MPRRRTWWIGALAALVLAGAVQSVPAMAAPDAASAVTASTTSGYQPLTPARVLDTRPGGPTVDGQSVGSGRVGPAQQVTVPIAGRGGVPLTGVGAVVLNVTGVGASSETWITVHPTGTARPTASNLNLAAGDTRPNAVVTALGDGGGITLVNAYGTVDLIVDVMGWYPTDGGLVGVQPARLLDSRTGGPTIDGANSGQGAFGPGTVRNLKVVGRGGVPASNVGAVVLNVTATQPTADSWLTVYPTGQPKPWASNVNMRPGQTVANLVIAPVGSDGRVSIANANGSTHVVVDVTGWLPVGGSYTGLTPVRLADTRPGTSTIDQLFAGIGRVLGGSRLQLPVAGRAGIPSDGVAAVVLNVTATEATAETYLTVFAGGGVRPLASNLNVRAGATAPNLVVAPVGADGSVNLFNAFGSVHVIVDVLGWIGVEVDVDPEPEPEEPDPGDAATVPVPGDLRDLVLSPDGDTAYLTDVLNPAIEIVDVAGERRDGTIPLPAAPSAVDLSPDGATLFVTLPTTGKLAVIDVTTRLITDLVTVPAVIDTSTHHRPTEVAVAADGTALVVLEGGWTGDWYGRIQRYDPTTDSFTEEPGVPPGGTNGSSATASGDRSKVMIANWEGIAILDVASGGWSLGRSWTGGGATLSGNHDGSTWMGATGFTDDLPLLLGAVPGFSMASAISADGRVGYGVFNLDGTADPWVTVVEAQHFRAVGRIPLPDTSTRQAQMALTPDGEQLVLATDHGVSIVATDDPPLDPLPLAPADPNATVPIAGRVQQLATDPGGLLVYATNSEANEVDVISLVTGVVVDRIPVGSRPDGLDLSDDGSTLYVVNAGGSDVSAVDLATREEIGRTPLVVAQGNPLELQAVRGHDIAIAGEDGFVTTDGLIAHHLDLPSFQAEPILYGTPNRNIFSPVEAEASEDKSLIAFHEYAGGQDLITWDAEADELVVSPATGFGAYGLALTPDGSRIAASYSIAQPDGRILGTAPPGVDQGGGMAYSRDGARVYKLAGDTISVLATDHFRHVGNIALPTFAPSLGGAPDLVLTRDGGHLIASTPGGISIVARAAVVPVDPPAPDTGNATVPLLGALGGVALDPTGQLAYVTRTDRNAVEVVSISQRRSLGQILVGSNPTDLDLSADGRTLYVVNSGADDLSVVDTVTRREIRRMRAPVGHLGRPTRIAVASDGTAMLYTAEYSPVLHHIDLATGTRLDVPDDIVLEHNAFYSPEASQDHTKLFVSGVGDVFDDTETVAVYDATTGTWTRRDTGASLWHPLRSDRTGDRWVAGHVVLGADLRVDGELPYIRSHTLDGPWGIAVRPDGQVAYRFSEGRIDVVELDHFRRTHTIPVPENPGFPWINHPSAGGEMWITPDGSNLVAVTRTGLSIMRTSDAVPVPPPTTWGSADVEIAGTVTDLVVDQAAAFAYATVEDDNVVEVVDVAAKERAATIKVGSRPIALDLSADGKRLYVVNRGGANVSVVDVAARRELRRIDLPALAFGDVPTSIAVSADGVAFIGLTEEPYLLRMDLTTEQIGLDVDPPPDVHPQLRVVVHSSTDKSTVAALGPAHGEQLISRYDATSHTWVRANPGGWFGLPSLNRTGSRIAFGNLVVNRSLQPVSRLVDETNWHGVLTPDGSSFWRFDDDKLHQYSTVTGALLNRYLLPSHVPDLYWTDGNMAAFTNDGDTLIIVGGGGIMISEIADLYWIDPAYE